MGYSDFDGHYRRAWNAGRKIGAKRVLRQKDVWPIRFWLDQEGRIRDSRALRPRDRQQAAKMRAGPFASAIWSPAMRSESGRS